MRVLGKSVLCYASGMRKFFLLVCLQTLAGAQAQTLEEQAAAYLQQYLRINTSNPPGHTVEAVRFLKGILDREGIPTEVYEAVPGSKINLIARLKATQSAGQKPLLLLHHMDVVPADPSRWPVDPFGGVIGTDSAEFRLKGAKAYGFLPVVVSPEIIASMHSDNERIPLEGFKNGVKIYYEMVAALVSGR